MGYFTEINNSSYRTQGIAEYNRANGKSGHTLLGVTLSQYAPSIFMGIAQKIASSSDGKGGSDNKNLSVDEQKKTLEKQLNKALSAIGVENIDKISDAIQKQENKVTTAKNKLEAFEKGTDDFSVRIKFLNSEKEPRNNLTEEQIAQIDKDIQTAKTEQDKAKKAVEKEYNNELKALQEMSVNADKANNINIQLKNLKALDESEKETPNYDVKQEVTDLSDFNKARENFLKNPSKETALALQNAFNAVDSENTKSAYNKYLKAKVNEILKNNK